MSEASPKGVGKFVLGVLLLLVLFFIAVLLWIRSEGHKPSMMKNSRLQNSGETFISLA
jgi:hypothetical protein